jgi:hypothetical protein
VVKSFVFVANVKIAGPPPLTIGSHTLPNNGTINENGGTRAGTVGGTVNNQTGKPCTQAC